MLRPFTTYRLSKDVLDLLYHAYQRFATIQLSMTTWYDIELQQEALQRWVSQQPVGSATILHTSSRAVKDMKSSVRENRVQLWLEQPARLRYEAYPFDGSHNVLVVNGTSEWSFASQNNPGTIRPAATTDVMERLERWDIALANMLDPVDLIPALALQPIEYTNHAARLAIIIEAQPRKQILRDPAPPVLWVGADRYQLIVDAKQGVLLDCTAFLGEQPFASRTITHAVFDDHISDSIFKLSLQSQV